MRTHSFMQELDKKTLALGLSESMREGVLFSTYAMLASSGGSRKNTRLDQIVAWCGGATFDGCIIFDECHRAKNCVRLSFCWRTSPHTHVASHRALLHITSHTRRVASRAVAHHFTHTSRRIARCCTSLHTHVALHRALLHTRCLAVATDGLRLIAKAKPQNLLSMFESHGVHW
jgi:hypothetical protein